LIKKKTNKRMETKSGMKTKWKKIIRDEIEKQKNQENNKKKPTNKETKKHNNQKNENQIW
jgi:hypothetical protein